MHYFDNNLLPRYEICGIITVWLDVFKCPIPKDLLLEILDGFKIAHISIIEECIEDLINEGKCYEENDCLFYFKTMYTNDTPNDYDIAFIKYLPTLWEEAKEEYKCPSNECISNLPLYIHYSSPGLLGEKPSHAYIDMIKENIPYEFLTDIFWMHHDNIDHYSKKLNEWFDKDASFIRMKNIHFVANHIYIDMFLVPDENGSVAQALKKLKDFKMNIISYFTLPMHNIVIAPTMMINEEE